MITRSSKYFSEIFSLNRLTVCAPASVIAISGLGGHSLGSFKQRHGEHMWLRDSLPRHITDEATSQPMARIMTYGYESRLQDSESMQNIEDLATAFHSSILPLVSSPRMKPIIFIAHSLGGLIVKQVCVCVVDRPPGLADAQLLSRPLSRCPGQKAKMTRGSCRPSTASPSSGFPTMAWISPL